MVDILTDIDLKKKSRSGEKNKLSIDYQLLMTLGYLMEYRTYFHISKSYGLSEKRAYKTIK